MYAFTTIGTNNLKKSSFFYSKILKVLNIKRVVINKRYHGFAKLKSQKKVELYIIKPYNKKKATIGNGTMVTFLAKSNKEVNEIFNTAIKYGAKDEGKPGPRHSRDYYAYIRDPDGNKLCICKRRS